MADRTFDVSVVLGLVDKMSSGLKQIDNSLNSTQKVLGSLAVAGISIYTVTNYLKDAVKASAQEEAAMFRLQFAVEKSGVAWLTSEKRVRAYLETAQAHSKFAGSDLIPGIQKITTFTGDLEKALKLTTLATDLAAYKNIDLATAVTAVSQASQGNLRMLGMLIPGMRGLDKETLGLATNADLARYALAQLQKTVGGFAEKELSQTEALMTQAGVKTDNLAQAMGKKLEPATRAMIMIFGEFIDILRRTIEKSYLLEVSLGFLGAAIVAAGVAFAMAAPQIAIISAAIILLSAGLVTALDALDKYLDAQNTSAAIHTEVIKQMNERIAKNQEEINSLIAKQIAEADDQAKVDAYQKEITRLTTQNITLRKLARQEEVSDIIATTEEATATSLESWTEWYEGLNGIQKLSADIGLGFLGTMKIETDKAMEEALAKINGYALRYDNVSSIMINSILRSKEQQELINKRKYEEGIVEMTTAWERYYYNMDGMSQNWLNRAIESYSAYFAYIEFGMATITDYMNKAYQLRTLIINNEKEDALTATEEKYIADQNRISTTVADEREKETQLAELDRWYMNEKSKLDKKAREDQRKAYDEQKNWSRNAALIDGAVAIIKTFAAYGFTPMGWVAAAAQAASTAMQIAIIDATRYATGIIGAPGGLAMVGEQGPELVNLPQGSDIFNASTTRGMLAAAGGGGMGINITVSGNYILDTRSAEGLADIISDIIVGRVKKERLI